MRRFPSASGCGGGRHEIFKVLFVNMPPPTDLSARELDTTDPLAPPAVETRYVNS
jgi:hypothetical protein